MKYLIRRDTQFLHSYTVVADDATDEFKRQLNQDVYGSPNYIEVDESEMYSFGLLKNEKEAYISSTEYKGEFDPPVFTTPSLIVLK